MGSRTACLPAATVWWCETIPDVTVSHAKSPFMLACRREPVPYTPVWFMRQAGRSLPEYRRVREGISMLDSCTRPELITEITLQPLRRYDVDAAILFSDIVVPLRAVGIDVDIKAGIGPVVEPPVRTSADLERLRPLNPDDVPYVTEAVRALVTELDERPLIGFAGGPFTLASYLVEGGPSKNHDKTKALMYGNPELWHALLGRLADITISFLQSRWRRVPRPFSSSTRGWARSARPITGTRSCRTPAGSSPRSERGKSRGVPRIHFGVGTGELLGLMGEAGADVVGVDWRIPLDEAARRVEPGKALQGNLDPAVLLAPWEVIEERASDVLARGRAAEGHVFNLGHGVLPETDPGVLARLADLVHAESVHASAGAPPRFAPSVSERAGQGTQCATKPRYRSVTVRPPGVLQPCCGRTPRTRAPRPPRCCARSRSRRTRRPGSAPRASDRAARRARRARARSGQRSAAAALACAATCRAASTVSRPSDLPQRGLDRMRLVAGDDLDDQAGPDVPVVGHDVTARLAQAGHRSQAPAVRTAAARRPQPGAICARRANWASRRPASKSGLSRTRTLA